MNPTKRLPRPRPSGQRIERRVSHFNKLAGRRDAMRGSAEAAASLSKPAIVFLSRPSAFGQINAPAGCANNANMAAMARVQMADCVDQSNGRSADEASSLPADSVRFHVDAAEPSSLSGELIVFAFLLSTAKSGFQSALALWPFTSRNPFAGQTMSYSSA